MWAPGIVGLTIGVLLLFFVSDSPEKNGYPPVEVVKQKVSWLVLHLLSAQLVYALPVASLPFGVPRASH